jgi:hypothetical protein
MLPVGDHVVMLRGEGDLGTQPSLTSVRLNASTPLTLRAEALPASLRIQPTPATATVLLDGVAIGHGAWTGHVRQGMHLVELRAEGFVSELRRVSAVAKKEAVVEVSLRAAAEGSQGKPGRVLLEADADFGIAPSLGGNVSSKSAPAIGFLTVGHAGYELGSGLGFLLDAGFLSLSERLASHPVALHPVGIPQDNLGSAEDKIRLSGLTVGASAQYHQGEKLPVTGRLGVGVLLATARDARTGTAFTNARMVGGVLVPAASYPFDVTESPKASYLYVAPELRQGLRLGAHAEITFGLRALIMVALTQPKWADEKPVEPGVTYRVGQLTFGPQQVTGNLIVVFVPGVGFRADF